MRRDEADLKRALVKAARAIPNTYATRHEERYGVGRLDLEIKFLGLPNAWIEAKVFDGHVFMPTPRQHVEGQRITAAGGLAVLIGWKWTEKRAHLFISRWTNYAKDNDCAHYEPGDDALNLREWIQRQ